MHLNELEALTSTNTDDITQAAEILSKSTGNTVLITLGKQGVHLFENGTHAFSFFQTGNCCRYDWCLVIPTSVLSLPCEQWALFSGSNLHGKSDCAKVVSVKGPIITTEEFENAKQDET